MCVCVCVCVCVCARARVCGAFVGLDSKLHKVHDSYIKITKSQQAKMYKTINKKTWNTISYKQKVHTVYIASGEKCTIKVLLCNIQYFIWLTLTCASTITTPT